MQPHKRRLVLCDAVPTIVSIHWGRSRARGLEFEYAAHFCDTHRRFAQTDWRPGHRGLKKIDHAEHPCGTVLDLRTHDEIFHNHFDSWLDGGQRVDGAGHPVYGSNWLGRLRDAFDHRTHIQEEPAEATEALADAIRLAEKLGSGEETDSARREQILTLLAAGETLAVSRHDANLRRSWGL
ncbi:hypothetical protein [Streptomyces sp. NPDC049555]|uniref:hypothetical protein n=1 Tax=Streptomyces sp. NPDC049555 TaxID=3154930 RepID=UPI00344921D2